MDCGFGFELGVSCIETRVMFCGWPVTDTLDSVHPFDKKKNQEVLIRAVFWLKRSKIYVCVGVRAGRLISPRQPPIPLNRKCLDLEQQKTRPNPREKARAPPPTQTSSLFIYTETPATVKLPPPRIYTCHYLQRCF